MEKLFRTSAWLMAVLFVVGMVGLIGCGNDDDDVVEEAAVLDKTTPEDGGTLPANGEVSLSFSKAPDSVEVNGTAVTAAKTTRVSLADLGASPGSLTLDISWEPGGGSASITLTITALDDTPPELVGSDPVSDGDDDVEYEGLEVIKLTFNEALDTTVSRVIEIAPDGGDSLKWGVTWEDGDTVAVLTAGKGGGLSAETKYEVIAKGPTDKAGNAADDVVITFTTRAKE